MEQEGPSLLELLEDKQMNLKCTRECIRLPVMYHPDSIWRSGNNGLYYRSSVFEEFTDLSGQPPRDISALKIDAMVEERMLVHELMEIGTRFNFLKRVMPPISLGEAAAPSSHTASRHAPIRKRKRALWHSNAVKAARK